MRERDRPHGPFREGRLRDRLLAIRRQGLRSRSLRLHSEALRRSPHRAHHLPASRQPRPDGKGTGAGRDRLHLTEDLPPDAGQDHHDLPCAGDRPDL